MRLYTAITLTGEIGWCRFMCTAAFLTVSRAHEMDFRRDFPAVRVSFIEWIKGRPNYTQKGKI